MGHAEKIPKFPSRRPWSRCSLLLSLHLTWRTSPWMALSVELGIKSSLGEVIPNTLPRKAWPLHGRLFNRQVCLAMIAPVFMSACGTWAGGVGRQFHFYICVKMHGSTSGRKLCSESCCQLTSYLTGIWQGRLFQSNGFVCILQILPRRLSLFWL